MKTVIGIIVFYNPQKELTKDVILAISGQVDHIIIVDNSLTTNTDIIPHNISADYIPLHKNVGIAEAQNIAIKRALQHNPDFVFFLDQDSIVEDRLVETLVTHYYNLVGKGYLVGAIGPRPINRQVGKEYRGSVKKGIPIDEVTTEVTELISSASLIPVENLKKSGYMDAYLFIDGVDHEWCWRCAKIMGARFFICENAHLSHQLGEGDRRFLWRKIAIPTPFRTYYQFRNYFILSRRNYVPIYWKLSNGLKYFVKIFYYSLFTSPRKSYIKNIFSGIRDGIKAIARK